MLCNLRLKYIAFVELSWGAEVNNRWQHRTRIFFRQNISTSDVVSCKFLLCFKALLSDRSMKNSRLTICTIQSQSFSNLIPSLVLIMRFLEKEFAWNEKRVGRSIRYSSVSTWYQFMNLTFVKFLFRVIRFNIIDSCNNITDVWKKSKIN